MRLERISDAEYFASEGLNASALKQFAHSPAHCKAYKNTPNKTSKAFDVGSMTHALVLEGETSWKVVEGDRRKKDVKEKVAEAEGDGFVVVNQKDEDSILGMNNSVRAHQDAQVIASDPKRAELAGFVECPITGLLLKAKYDWLPEFGPKVYDLKTCADATPRKFKYAVYDFKYQIQAMHYVYVAQLLGLPKQEFVFVAVEKTAPYGVMCYELDAEYFEKEMPYYMGLLKSYAKCLAEDDFSECYSLGLHKLDI